jgi:hypothetical protein
MLAVTKTSGVVMRRAEVELAGFVPSFSTTANEERLGPPIGESSPEDLESHMHNVNRPVSCRVGTVEIENWPFTGSPPIR